MISDPARRGKGGEPGFYEGLKLGDEDLQFLSDFYSVLELGSRGMGGNTHDRLAHYYKASGLDLELTEGIYPFERPSSVYSSSKVVQRAEVLMRDVIAGHLADGELSGSIDSGDIPHGDSYETRGDTAFTGSEGLVRGKDWRWSGQSKYQRSLRGFLWAEQSNAGLKNTDNNFMLSASWKAVQGTDGGFNVDITWSVRDLYVFKSAKEMRALDLDPATFRTDIMGRIEVSDAFLQHAEALGWAQRYYSNVAWRETVTMQGGRSK